jgi:hypothetical protein
MKIGNLFLIAGLTAAGFFAAPTLEAKAETRYHMWLPGFPPPPPRRHYYYYPEAYEDEEDYANPYEEEDYDAYYYYGEEDDYFEPAPRQYAPKPRKKSKTVTVAPQDEPEPAPPPKIKKKPAATAAAAAPKPKTETKSASVSCDKARSIITGYGFGNIETKSCTGNVYSFAAVRGGKSFSVKVSALSGELTEVKRQ